jgi:excisionase family DNA binding protein
MTLTVPEAARRLGRNPETVRRWIREGRLRSSRVGTQHIIEEADLDAAIHHDELPVPIGWRTTMTGGAMPNIAATLHRSRAGH